MFGKKSNYFNFNVNFFKFYLIVMIAQKPKPAKYCMKLHKIHILVGRKGQPKGGGEGKITITSIESSGTCKFQ